ncbi:MAG: CPBP family intramembrane glutamic endopeptidase [Hyphomicrobiaceae bacterium]|nr:CPBP family intramembrane glutamic endopeptidase [Hyphomicrobiaceae bacterium]
MEAQVDPPQAAPPGRLFAGPAAFAARTPWGPWGGLIMAVAVAILAMAVSAAVLMTGVTGGQGSVPGDTIGIAALGVWQVAVVLLTLLAARLRGPVRDGLCLGPAGGWRIYIGAVLLVLVFQVVVSALELVFVPSEMFRDLRQFVGLARGPAWVLVLLVIGIGAPLAEELLFRGFLLPALSRSRLGFTGAALLSTALWTTLHAGYSLVGLLEVFLVGLVFSWLLYRTGSIRVTILCHALYNSLIMLVLRYAPLPAALTGPG